MSNIFVFGSNMAGRHGKGAALTARCRYGAEYGVGVGATGRAYALPTKDEELKTLPLRGIKLRVRELCQYAANNMKDTFIVTKVGCGLAGYKDEEIAPLFEVSEPNMVFDLDWEIYLGNQPRRYFDREKLMKQPRVAVIGSRRIEHPEYRVLVNAAKYLCNQDFCITSGGAKGADSAGEEGADMVHGSKLIYHLPNRVTTRNYDIKEVQDIMNENRHKALLVAKDMHPAWEKLSTHVKELMTRNVFQVMGHELDNPVEFVVCYTSDGAEESTTQETGGTGQAIRIANRMNIPVINLGAPGGSGLFAEKVAMYTKRYWKTVFQEIN